MHISVCRKKKQEGRLTRALMGKLKQDMDFLGNNNKEGNPLPKFNPGWLKL